MKHIISITSASAASLLALTAWAQETTYEPVTDNDSTHATMTQGRAECLNGTAKASEVIGMAVNNNQEEKLGKVSELAVDMESGRAQASHRRIRACQSDRRQCPR